MGGDDHPDNLIELTIEEHAEAHYQLWLMYRCPEDEIAYLCLSGQITNAEANRLSFQLGGKIVGSRKKTEEHKRNIGKANKGKPGNLGENNGMFGKNHSDEVKNKISSINKGRKAWNKGIPCSPERKLKQSIAMKNRKKAKA